MPHTGPTILYTDDDAANRKDLVPFLEFFLDARVTAYTSNDFASSRFFDEGKRFDAYIFDNSTPPSELPGTTLAMEIAEALRGESRTSPVISVCSEEWPRDQLAEDLRRENIVPWIKSLDRFVMVAWLADCRKQRIAIPRDEWLRSVGEDPEDRLSGNPVRRELGSLMFITLSNEHRGAFNRISMPDLFRRLRDGGKITETIEELDRRRPSRPESDR